MEAVAVKQPGSTMLPGTSFQRIYNCSKLKANLGSHREALWVLNAPEWSLQSEYLSDLITAQPNVPSKVDELMPGPCRHAVASPVAHGQN